MPDQKEPPQQPSSSSSSSAVDDAFERLFGYKFGTTFDLPTPSTTTTTSTETKQPIVNKPITTVSTTTTTATQQLLDIFGRTRAARILGSIGKKTTSRMKRPSSSTNNDNDDTITSNNNKRRRRNYKDIELPQLNLKTVTETKVFAGQTIQTTVTKVASSSTDSAAATAGGGKKKPPPPKTTAATKTKKKSNIDNVLEQLADPKKMNTVEKTSNDWEQLKEKDTILKEELEKKAQSNSAYLVKQDFLTRVDQRKFEIEKDQRDRERAKRSVPGGS